MKTFVLDDIQDETGVRGMGVVAEGVMFQSGKCVISWLLRVPSITVYDSIGDVELIHGQNGRTRIVWNEDVPESDSK